MVMEFILHAKRPTLLIMNFGISRLALSELENLRKRQQNEMLLNRFHIYSK